jgi:hypothetical protein
LLQHDLAAGDNKAGTVAAFSDDDRACRQLSFVCRSGNRREFRGRKIAPFECGENGSLAIPERSGVRYAGFSSS